MTMYLAADRDNSTARHVLPNGDVLIFTPSTAFPGYRLLLYIPKKRKASK